MGATIDRPPSPSRVALTTLRFRDLKRRWTQLCDEFAEEFGTEWTEAALAARPRPRPLDPLDARAVLWLAAISLVPIEERVEWVEKMMQHVEAINAYRASRSGPRPSASPKRIPRW